MSRTPNALIARAALVAALATVPPLAFVARAGQALPAAHQDAIDRVFAPYATDRSPGCAVAVYRNGAIAFARGYGLASLEHGVPISPQTVFDIGSTSKQFTAFAILLLVHDGRLSLDDAVQKHIPELPAYERPVTVRHLLQHTSGLRDYLTLWSLAGVRTENWTTHEEAVALVVRQRHANFAASSEFLYSNSGYLLLSEIVRRVSGKDLPAFAAERIFEPLGMKATFFLDDHQKVIPRRATGYSPRAGGGFEVDMSDFEQTGDGAVQTTVEDLLAWDGNFYAPKVGTAALLQIMQTPGTLDSGKPIEYGAGLTMGTLRGLRTVRHGGSWAGYRAELLRVPDQRTSVACLCNLGSSNPSVLADRVASIVLAGALGPEKPGAAAASQAAVAVPAERLAALAGVYESAAGAFQQISVGGGGLRLGSGNGRPLKAVATDRFVNEEAGVQLLFPVPAAGAAQEMRLVRGGGEPDVYRLVPAPPAQRLDDLAGRYDSPELGATWVVLVQDGRLHVQLPGARPAALTLVKPDVFRTDSGLVVRFERAGGAAVRVVAQAGRVTNLGFERR